MSSSLTKFNIVFSELFYKVKINKIADVDERKRMPYWPFWSIYVQEVYLRGENKIWSIGKAFESEASRISLHRNPLMQHK